MADFVSFPLRVERQVWRKFQAIAATQDMTPTEILRECVSKYIAEHIDAARRALDDDD